MGSVQDLEATIEPCGVRKLGFRLQIICSATGTEFAHKEAGSPIPAPGETAYADPGLVRYGGLNQHEAHTAA